MSSPTQWKVYARKRGQKTRAMMAQFAVGADAAQYARQESTAVYGLGYTLTVVYLGKAQVRYCNGRRVWQRK